MMREFWIVEYNGTAQIGHAEQYYAIEAAEENFGEVPGRDGKTYQLVLYTPSDSPDGIVPLSRDQCLALIGESPAEPERPRDQQ